MMCHSILFFNHFLCLLLLRELCCVYFCQQYLACFRYSSPNSFSSFCPLVTSWCRQYVIHRPSLACTSLSVLPDRRIGSVLFFYSTRLYCALHYSTLHYSTLLYFTIIDSRDSSAFYPFYLDIMNYCTRLISFPPPRIAKLSLIRGISVLTALITPMHSLIYTYYPRHCRNERKWLFLRQPALLQGHLSQQPLLLLLLWWVSN